ncbi:DegQ family serine endoprotease [Aquisalimonas lutea]|uniref:DegQ family serine endoprotease n=1 Tax=Aquisalimonas lutea TaxID=1327750 RepID=UPI0025B383AB|nr:DegQ family serine endoprotease [Aquisalimonas lutea]MDN3517013.1 DegQ family serine endoprotease [Aquisalimonas lutea]
MKHVQRVLASVALIAALAASPVHAALPSAGSSGNGQPTLAPLVEEVSPAVVNIATRGTVEAEQHPLMRHPFFREFFDELPRERRQREVQSLGSGVIVDADEGYILTNHHVIANADQITVGLQDNREFEAEVIGSDPETDIAVIRIDANNLEEATLGDSDTLRTGDYVLALGNPFGLDHTVTSGIVSGLGRSLSGRASQARIQDFIQTDASINPGNSGGALVDLNGDVVGINTAILSRSGGNIGIGFAVPINMAQTVMEQLIEHGEIRRGVLGVRVQDLTGELANAMDVDADQGALVAQISPGSAAEEAGLQQGDVITAVNDETIEGPNALAKAIGLMQPGDEVRLRILRNGEEQTVTAELQARDETAMRSGAGTTSGPLAGATFADLDESSSLHGKVDGVRVTSVEPGSSAARYLQEGDVITSVNRRPVTSMDEFRQAIQGQSELLLHVYRGDRALFIVVK